jgi:predicted PurR-regulated permease PerM
VKAFGKACLVGFPSLGAIAYLFISAKPFGITFLVAPYSLGFLPSSERLFFVVLGVPYSLLFAVLIGIASLIPFVAGLVILGSSFLLCFHSPTLAFWFLVTAVIIDNLTDNVFAPRIMGNLIGLNPVWIIISLFIGAKLGGILGLFLAVPLASVIKHVIDDLRAESSQSFTHRKQEETILIEQTQDLE